MKSESCEDRGHGYNRHHHHCYHCGRMGEVHHSWCPDWGTNPDPGLVGFWNGSVGCNA